MISNFFKGTLLIISTFFLISCESLPVNYSHSQSFRSFEKNNSRAADKRITINLLKVQVDKTGGMYSLENEVSAIAPLYFWKQGCKVVGKNDNPQYFTQINIREREYPQGWQTKKSLAIEVFFWDNRNSLQDPLPDQTLPAASGRIVSIGERSFSSSDTTSRLLYKAIKLAVKELAAYDKAVKKAAANATAAANANAVANDVADAAAKATANAYGKQLSHSPWIEDI